jgi:hypothetical protein
VEAISRVEPFAQVWPNRLDVFVSPGYLALYTNNKNGEAIEVFPCDTSAKGTFVVNYKLFKEIVEKTDTFYFTDSSIVYFSSEKGLETILLGLGGSGAEPYAKDVLDRIDLSVREVEKSGQQGREEKGKEEAVKGSTKERKRIPKWEDPVPF